MRLTSDQQRVVDARGTNLLVSAAAGSGKTAVLISRILSLVQGPEQCDIDRFLIVTFTVAAAREMKERLTKELLLLSANDPSDQHLAKQLHYIHRADITTIDSFCSGIVKGYGQLIDLPVSWQIGDDSRMQMIRERVLDDLFEQEYETGAPDFLDFIERTATGKLDSVARERILALYHTVMAGPDPEGTLAAMDAEILDDCTHAMDAAWIRELLRDAATLVEDGRHMAEQNLQLLAEHPSLLRYQPVAEGDLACFDALCDAHEYSSYDQTLRSLSRTRMPGGRFTPAPEDADALSTFKSQHTALVDLLKVLTEEYFALPEALLIDVMQESTKILCPLLRLTKAFHARYLEAKTKLGIFDFADIEQFALTLLVDGNGRRSGVARELAARYDHVLIDEYQDSNDLQEAILCAVSRIEDGDPNYFMVGDIKQSIYAFRQARPDLFLRKYLSFPMHPEEGERIDLQKNFRSRSEILSVTNDLFSGIMRPEIGGIRYDKDAALYDGASFPPLQEDALDPSVELLLPFSDDEGTDTAHADEKRRLAAQVIGNEIQKIVGTKTIADQKTGTYRPVSYGDIVILLRVGASWTETFTTVLGDMGIPYYAQERTGYFSAPEVVSVLQFLEILDNPRQDIPLAGVLHSAMVGLTSEDLARIRIFGTEKKEFRDCVWGYAQDGDDPSLQTSLASFIDRYEELRALARTIPTHILIEKILSVTGYGAYVQGLPGGAQRSQNLSMLMEKARAYAESGQEGLTHFVQYIRSLKQYQIDFGQAPVDAGEQVVRIMTIHKSKGLEFPIVFVAGLERRFDGRDLRTNVLIHPRYGLACDAIDPQTRLRTPSPKRAYLARKMLDDATGEEQRILYVAMTRAMQKLYLVGIVKDHEALETIRRSPMERPLPMTVLRSAKSHLGMILPIFLCASPDLPLVVREIPTSAQDIGRSGRHAVDERRIMQTLLSDGKGTPDASSPLAETLLARFSWHYPYEGRDVIPAKISVSELKALHYADEDAVQTIEDPVVVPYIPSFIEENEETAVTGASRGTAYHSFMEHLSYDTLPDGDDKDALRLFVQAQLQDLVSARALPEESAKAIVPDDIVQFLTSPLGQRMRKAAIAGCLFRESAFTYTLPADRIDPAYSAEESVLVQGVMDAYFTEEDNIVLVDYKTDHIASGDPGELQSRYGIQLRTYADALSRLCGKRVAEIYIYSFYFGESFLVSSEP